MDGIFREKQQFLAKPFLPKLALSFLKRLNKLAEASKSLGFEPAQRVIALPYFTHPKLDSLIAVYRHYTSETARYQLVLMELEEFSAIEQLVKDYTLFFRRYASAYCNIFESEHGNPMVKDVKLSERIDPMEVLSDLQTQNFLKSPALEYSRLKLVSAMTS